MRKLLLLTLMCLFVFPVISFAEETKNAYPARFSCKILEERFQGNELKYKGQILFYKYDNIYRVDVMGFAYIIDESHKKLYSIYGSEYTEEELNGPASGYLSFAGVGFLDPNNVNVQKVNTTEKVLGYECEVKDIKEDTLGSIIWQAPSLGNLALKYEKTEKDGKTRKTVIELNPNLTDKSAFKLSIKGKKSIIIIQ